MPIYEYRCSNDHTFEVMQRMTDDPVTECQVCGVGVERVYHPIAVHFKGKGFYNTDYGTRRRQRELASSAESGANNRSESESSKSSSSDSGSGSGSGDSSSKSSSDSGSKSAGDSAKNGASKAKKPAA